MASLNAWRGTSEPAGLHGSKHAVLGLLRTAALDPAGFGIRVNGLAPGPVLTAAFRERLERRARRAAFAVERGAREAAAGQRSDGIATEEDVARAALFLASDLSSGITGALLPVDGGIV